MENHMRSHILTASLVSSQNGIARVLQKLNTIIFIYFKIKNYPNHYNGLKTMYCTYVCIQKQNTVLLFNVLFV